MRFFRWALCSKRNYLIGTTIWFSLPTAALFIAYQVATGVFNAEIVAVLALICGLGGFAFAVLTWHAWGKYHQLPPN